MQNLFDDIYTKSAWSHEGDGSGEGSSLEFTENTRYMLGNIIEKLHVQSLLDFPCGSCLWMAQFLSTLKRPISYVGVDVSSIAVERAKTNLARIDTCQVNILHGDLLTHKHDKPVDLVMCRDALQHLSISNVYKALENLASIDAKWYLIGSYTGGINKNIPNGHYFNIDLMTTPFNLKPFKIYCEDHPDSDMDLPKHLYLYSKDSFTRQVYTMKKNMPFINNVVFEDMRSV